MIAAPGETGYDGGVPSPYHWAACTLIGDLDAVASLSPSRRWLWIGAGALLVALIGAWVWRRR